MKGRVVTASLCVLALAACSSPPAPSYAAAVVSQTSFASLGVPAGEQVIGLAIDPIDGVRTLAIAPAAGGAELTLAVSEDGVLRTVWSDVLGFVAEDVVALSPGRFALIAPNMGYLLEIETGAVTQFFCYLPGSLEDEWPQDQTQVSHAVAYDARADRLWAQPRTFRGAELLRSEIATFSGASGEDLAWIDLGDADFDASAMVALPDEGEPMLVLSARNAIHAYAPDRPQGAPIAAFVEIGATRIDALAWDPTSGHVIAVDGVRRELIELDVHARAASR